jgi:chromatin remodeling complex protein RSC6
MSSVPFAAAPESHFLDKVILDDTAVEFFSLPKETTRADLTRAFVKYSTEYGLLNADGETLHLNEELLELLDLESRERVTILNLASFLRYLYTIPGKEPSKFQTPVLLCDKLAAFLGLPSGSKLTRAEVTRAICAYCKTHGLIDRHVINADAALMELLGLQPGDYLSILNLQRYLSDLYYKL